MPVIQPPPEAVAESPGGIDEPPIVPAADSSATPTPLATSQRPVSYARALQRRRSRKNLFWIPVLCGVALVGCIAGWFFWQGQTSLEGRLEAVELIEPNLDPKMLDDADIALESDQIRAVLAYLKEKPIRGLDSGQLMEHDVVVTDAGMTIQVLEPTGMRFFRVNIKGHAGLSKYYKAHQKTLDKARLKELGKAATTFFRECLKAAENDETLSIDGLDRFRRQVAVNCLIGGLGYNVVASVNKKAYLCVYEDAQALYFLLPVGTSRFRLKGRRIDGAIVFPGKFDVEVTDVRKPEAAKSSSQADEPPEKTQESGKTEEAPPGKKTDPSNED